MDLKAQLAEFAERQAALQERLASLTSSLRKFDLREQEAKIEAENIKKQVAAEISDRLARKRQSRPCHIAKLPVDLLTKVLVHVPAPSIFTAAVISKQFHEAQRDETFWEARMLTDLGEYPDSNEHRSIKAVYRDRVFRWSRIQETLKWLTDMQCPSDVNGTMTGPWSRKNLIIVLTDLVSLTGPSSAAWRRADALQRVRSLCGLLSSSKEVVQELAAAALANILRASAAGGDLLGRHDAAKPLRGLLFSSCVGVQKQAARATVNAWLPDPAAVAAPCPHPLVRTPRRLARAAAAADGSECGGGGGGGGDAGSAGASAAGGDGCCHDAGGGGSGGGVGGDGGGGGGEGEMRAVWQYVEFSPSGTQGTSSHVTLAVRGGRLWGWGEDSLGPFTLAEATLNRTLQWMSGACGDDDSSADRPAAAGGTGRRRSSREAWIPCEGDVPAKAAGGAGSLEALADGTPANGRDKNALIDLLRAAGHCTPHELAAAPSIAAAAAAAAAGRVGVHQPEPAASGGLRRPSSAGGNFAGGGRAAARGAGGGNEPAQATAGNFGGGGIASVGQMDTAEERKGQASGTGSGKDGKASAGGTSGDGKGPAGLERLGGGFGEVVQRVAGFQRRYGFGLGAGEAAAAAAAAAAAGGVAGPSVSSGAEHLVLHKTYRHGHGHDHVRLVAFPDALGFFGVWERGRYQYHHRMDNSSRGAFRMWQP